MILCGIDPGSSKLGMAFLKIDNGGTPILLGVHHIEPRKATFNLRMKEIFHEVSELFEHYKPEKIWIESQFLRSNPDAFKKLCYAVGVIMASNYSFSDAEMEIINVKSWRKAIIGNGNASKKETIEKLKQIIPNIPETIEEDSIEAIGIAYALFHSKKENSIGKTKRKSKKNG